MPDLERRLRGLGPHVAFPDEPALAGAVVERLRARRHERAIRPRRLALALALALAAVAAAVAVPQARTALLELLGLRGAAVERVETLPPVDAASPLVPGRRVTFAEAQRAVDFPLLAPRGPGGGRCGAVYLSVTVPGGMVSVVCSARGPRPLVLTQFRGEHRPFVYKAVAGSTRAEEVEVDGAPGLWLEGAPHVVVFRDAEGEVREAVRRLAGDVLLWERDGITYRLEGALRGREHALGVARDLR